jgi:hypothetical protein
VPIHTVYKAPPRELLPRYSEEEVMSEKFEEESREVRREDAPSPRKGGYRFVTSVASVAALVVLTAAVLGSGYLDSLIVSVNQVHEISGIEVYNK